MSTEKHIKLTGYSNISWKDAIVKTIDSASKTLENLSNVEVITQRARITNGKIIEYIVDLDVSFFIKENNESQDTDNM